LLRTALLVSTLALGLVGCGSSDPSGSDADASGRSTHGNDAAATVPKDLCSLVTAAELSQALGVTVTTEIGPSGDCEFDEADPRGISGSVGVVPDAETNGGYDAYLSGLDATLKDPILTEISGLGDAAAVKVGLPTMGSGTNFLAGGVVDHGTYLLQVTLGQARDMDAATLGRAAEKVLRLIDTKSS